jgi:hypothetical protein
MDHGFSKLPSGRERYTKISMSAGVGWIEPQQLLAMLCSRFILFVLKGRNRQSE